MMLWEAKEYGYHMTLHKKKKYLNYLEGKWDNYLVGMYFFAIMHYIQN